jgi:hypothetical protein
MVRTPMAPAPGPVARDWTLPHTAVVHPFHICKFPVSMTAVLLVAAVAGANSDAVALRITSDFESGSARVLSTDAATQTIRITPAGDPVRGMPTWWYVRVDGIDTSKPLTLEVIARDATTPNDDGVHRPLNPNWTLPTRAALSTDGVTWTQTEPGERKDDLGTYRVPKPAPTLWLAWGPPFTATQASEYVQRAVREHPSAAQAFTLAESREHRSVPGLRIAEGDRPAAKRPAVWVIARQHAWECGGTWVGLGLSDWLLSDHESAVALRREAEIYLVPVMDVDHVATGDGGKNARPQDHNRDWSETPHWPEVAAAQKRLLEIAKEGRLEVFLDLHNPSAGASVQAFYVQGPPYISKTATAAQQRFVDGARTLFGEIKLNDGNPSVPAHRPIWERISTPWVLLHGHATTVAVTVETPWNTEQGTPDGYREVGRKLGLALAQYLSSRP